MEPSKKPRAKICCISSIEEARMAIRYGASALGFVSRMPSGPGVITEDLIADIVACVPPGIATFLLTSRQTAEEVIEQQRKTGVNTIQFCDAVEPHEYPRMRAAMKGVKLVQVVHVTGIESLAEAQLVSRFADGILLDSGNRSLAVKQLGGTGRTHDWSISRRIREAVPIPLYLAGGLKPENVRQAVESVRPFAVDVCSGVRSEGRLDEATLARFMSFLDTV